MKKHILLSLFILVSFIALFSSCKKDEETKKDVLVARWQGEKITSTATINGVPFPIDDEDISTTFVDFNSNGTYTSDDNGIFDGSGTWKLSNGDKDLILDEGTDNEIIFTITTLTSSDLKLSFTQEETQNGVVIKATVVVDFKK